MRLRSIKKSKDKYAYKKIEEEFHKNHVLPEIAREKAILEEKKAVY